MMQECIEPGQVWRGKGSGSGQKIAILYCLDNGQVGFERIAGAPDHALHKEQKAPVENIRAAYQLTEERHSIFDSMEVGP
jgi:hypothetical protein